MRGGDSAGMAEALAKFEPRRFRSTVPFYARYRLGYPEALIARVIEIAHLAAGDRVLDLGCGPGLLAIPFAKAGMRVTAVDPEPDMLQAARQSAEDARVHIDARLGSSFAFPQDLGPVRLVTIGRAFHWMDREDTLRKLDAIVAEDGAVALFGDGHPKTVENRWRSMLRDVGKRHGEPPSAYEAARAGPDYRSHESVLLGSPFRRLERASLIIRRTITIDEVVGLAFSRSSSSPEKLGERAEAFERDLREELGRIARDGELTEIAEPEALLAHRG